MFIKGSDYEAIIASESSLININKSLKGDDNSAIGFTFFAGKNYRYYYVNKKIEEVYCMRQKMPNGKDNKVFRRTAAKSKKININPTIFRGGIRL